jgi:allophanate hydrolase
MAEPTRWSIADARSLVARRSARAVVEELLARRARRPQAAAWTSLVAPEALEARAARVDAMLAAGADLPLAGVPFAVKDNIDVAGIPTTAGCPEYAYVPARSATVVEALLAAGAMFTGKTNLDQFATGLVGTRSPATGPCVNPVDHTFIAGGSSSGSAVVVATGEVSFALGTDTAGSGRVPAALCDVVGLKPTPGVVPVDGVVPAMRSLDCMSAFTGTVHDAATVFEVVGPSASRPGPPPTRLGIPSPLDWVGDDDARACFERAVELLVATGVSVTEVDGAPARDAGALVYGSALVAERHDAFGAFALAHPDAMDPAVLDVVRRAGAHSATGFAHALATLAALRADAAGWWDEVDALVLPTVARVPTLAEALADPFGPSVELGRLTAFVNPLGLAAVALPAGRRRSGVPFGISLVGPGGTDRDLLALAAAFSGEADEGLRVAARPHRLAVVGAHLTGQPLNHQLTDRGAVLCGTTTTTADYRLFALDTTPPKPGLVRAPGAGAAIELEVWALDAAAFGEFVAAIPAPLGVGKVTLADGSEVTGFLCEPHALAGAPEITGLGGWRAHLARGA